MITDKIGSAINTGVSAELRVESSKTVLEEDVIPWVSPKGVCTLSEMASVTGETRVLEGPALST